jgi:hypothetical protein
MHYFRKIRFNIIIECTPMFLSFQSWLQYVLLVVFPSAQFRRFRKPGQTSRKARIEVLAALGTRRCIGCYTSVSKEPDASIFRISEVKMKVAGSFKPHGVIFHKTVIRSGASLEHYHYTRLLCLVKYERKQEVPLPASVRFQDVFCFKSHLDCSWWT